MDTANHLPPLLPDLDLCPVAGGEFLMGEDKSKYDNEKPAHSVRVSGFDMGKFPVTQRLWQAVTGSNPSKFKGERCPVEMVSWEDVQSFLDKLNARADVQAFIHQRSPSGTKFRLPTEAEWEFAARGGIYSQGYTYAGSDRLKQVSWHNKNSDNRPHNVGQLLANELDLYDMSGNVWEWCHDRFSNKYYEECHKRGVVENPAGPATDADRVLRGGCWFFNPVCCRSVARDNGAPENRGDRIGFRLALPFQAVG